jgi:anti-sigma B factor antagonist
LYTALGVFASRNEAEAAYRMLLERHVPPREIVYLTRTDDQGATTSKKISSALGGVLGAAGGMTAGIGAAMLLAVPGIGQVVALGAGAAALLGFAGAGAASHSRADLDDSIVRPTPGQDCPDDVALFRRVLSEGHNLIVVRSPSQEIANVANGVLSRLGLNIQEHLPAKMHVSRRQLDDIAVISFGGQITFLDGSSGLRQLVRETLDQGFKKIVFNMRDVDYLDSSGLGELVKSYTTVHSNGGQLKLAEVNPRVQELLQITKLHLVLESEPDEASAIQSFRADSSAHAAG